MSLLRLTTNRKSITLIVTKTMTTALTFQHIEIMPMLLLAGETWVKPYNAQKT